MFIYVIDQAKQVEQATNLINNIKTNSAKKPLKNAAKHSSVIKLYITIYTSRNIKITKIVKKMKISEKKVKKMYIFYKTGKKG